MREGKHKPLRMCVCCRKMLERDALYKVVKPKDADAVIDDTGKAPGRGAYVCKNAECIAKARKAQRFERALSCTVSREIYDILESRMQNDGK